MLDWFRCSVSLILLNTLLSSGSIWGQEDVRLRVGYAQTEVEAKQEIEQLTKSIADLDAWKNRRELLRGSILKAARLDRFPERTPLKTHYVKPRNYDGYRVENVSLESAPGFFVTGSLYRPINFQGKMAVVASPHGHDGRFKAERQKRCAVLAKMGAPYSCMTWSDMAIQKKLAGTIEKRRSFAPSNLEQYPRN